MQNPTNKILAILISVLMIISIGAVITQLPKAAGVVNIQTFAFINVAPDPCGVGQSVTVDFWTAVPMQTSEHDTNLTVRITDPNGVTTTQGPYVADFTGGTTFQYVPTMPGNYTFQTVFLGFTLNGGSTSPYTGDYDEPSVSSIATLVVTNTPAAEAQFTPLPTSYWQTPVSAENVQNWYAITGPWLGLMAYIFASTGMYNDSGPYNPYTTGPTSAHILWTKPWCVGGVAGDGYSSEQFGSYFTTSQYQPKYAPVIIDGMMYSTQYTTCTASMGNMGIVAVNLYNGQTEWVINTTNPLRCGMLVDYETINQYGVDGPFILTTGTLPAGDTGGSIIPESGTQWNLYDALTGAYCESIVNGTSPSFLTADASGDLIGYYTNSTVGTEIVHPVSGPAVVVTTVAGENARFCAWNMSLCLDGFDSGKNTLTRFELGIMYANPSIPNNMTSTAYPNGGSIGGLSGWQIGSGVIVLAAGAGVASVGETAGYLVQVGFDQATGNLLWGPFNRTETAYTRLSENSMYLAGDGVYIDLNMATDVMNGYSLYTGNLLWTNTLVTSNGQPVSPYDDYGIQDIVDCTTGQIILSGLGGDIWDVNMANGNIVWWTCTTLLQGSSGTETPYGTWPIWVQWNGVAAGQNNLAYLSEGHEYSPPLFHEAQQLCINMTNGALVWKNLAFDDDGGAIAYGVFTTYNAYDGQIYAYGQGPSATTVTAPDVGVTTATPITMTGTVMDVSAGATQEAVAANFPNGLPCVSDASMSQWMEYVYEQQPNPSNTTGVPVTLTAIDPNGNTVTLGTTTTDQSGFYSLTYTPPIPGHYTVIATFAGTGGYYGSYAESAFYASNPPSTPVPTATPVSNVATMSGLTIGIVAAAIAIIIAIAIVGLLILRKKP